MKIQKVMKYLSLIFFGACLLMSAGCALLKTKQTQTPVVQVFQQTLQLPAPKALNLHFNASQLLTATYLINGQKKSYTTQVEVEASADKIVLVAAAGWGGSIFSLVYDGVCIQSSTLPMPNANMGVKQTLIDFIFSNASVDVLEKMLKGSNITLKIAPGRRVFMLKGKKVMEIHYQKDPKRKYDEIVIDNNLYHYQVKVKTLSQS
ncbi:DUF3261 domain-containing protein [Facilibium subflavum]|uniref:DUF3261 domain-containing protein n=1 Tax=Facilibium subflavum TaxID=2219058 RepID=UPI000E64F889|nr:DUF3261 domain-containing protein [Facilibium subflavum]